MNGTSSGSDLQARLQKRAEQDRQEIEALTQSELKKLAENLRQSVNDEMYIIVRDIKDHTRWMNAALWRPWLRSVTVGVCLFLGILAGSWGLTRWYANQIQRPHRDAGGARDRDPRGAPDPRADRANHVGSETRRGQRAALRDPAGEHPRQSARDHGRTAYRQAIERVKELYDRVRTAVDERLNRAVEAVRSGDGAAGRVVGELQEQVQRLEESVKDLKPQLGRTEASAKDLKQQVEILAANYKEIAGVLGGFERDLETAAGGAGTAARPGARLWPQPLGLSQRRLVPLVAWVPKSTMSPHVCVYLQPVLNTG